MMRLQPSGYRLSSPGHPPLWKADNGRLLWVRYGIDCQSSEVLTEYSLKGSFLGDNYVNVVTGKIDPFRPPSELWVTADESVLSTYRTVVVIAEDGLQETHPVVLLERLTLAAPPP